MAKPFTKKGWRNFKIIAGGIDVIQWIIDPTGVGAAINAIADPIIGIVFALVYWRKKAINSKSFAALVASFIGEEVTVEVAPCWVLDVWYTERKAPNPEEGDVATNTVLNYAVGPANQNGVRQPDNTGQKPLNIKVNGTNVRPPSPA